MSIYGKQHKEASPLVVICLFLFTSVVSYQFGISAIWFCLGGMFLFPAIDERIKGDTSYADFLYELMLGVTFIVIGGIQIGSSMTVQDLFLSCSKYTMYHFMIHLTWALALLTLTVLDFISTGGFWNFSKFLRSLFKAFRMLLQCIGLSILIQTQHSLHFSR